MSSAGGSLVEGHTQLPGDAAAVAEPRKPSGEWVPIRRHLDVPLIGEPVEQDVEARLVLAVEEKLNCGGEPEGMYIRAVDASERLVGDPECSALDGSFSAWVVWFVEVEVKDLGVGKGRDVEAHGLLGLPGEHQEGRQCHKPTLQTLRK